MGAGYKRRGDRLNRESEGRGERERERERSGGVHGCEKEEEEGRLEDHSKKPRGANAE